MYYEPQGLLLVRIPVSSGKKNILLEKIIYINVTVVVFW